MTQDAAPAEEISPPVDRAIALYVFEGLCAAEAELDRRLESPGVSNYLVHLRRVVATELWGDRRREDACATCGGYGYVRDPDCPLVEVIRCQRPCPTCMGSTLGGEWQGCICARNQRPGDPEKTCCYGHPESKKWPTCSACHSAPGFGGGPRYGGWQ